MEEEEETVDHDDDDIYIYIYIVLRGRWCAIIVRNAHAPTEDKSDESRNSFREVLEQFFDYFYP